MGKKQAADILAELLPENSLTLVDVGAAQFDTRRWRGMERLLRIVGFEPQAEEFAKLEQGPGRHWIEAALAGRRETRDFFITNYWSNCSLLRPNAAVVRELSTDEWLEVRAVEKVECMPLDDVLAQENIEADFLKVDTQGSELEILQGARVALRDQLVIVESEVEFCELYGHQPQFAEVDQFMRQSGFILQDLGNFMYLKPRGLAFIGAPKGRLVSCDALFLKNPREAAEHLMERGERKVLAAVAGYLAYGYPELGLVLLDKVKERGFTVRRAAELAVVLAQVSHAPSVLKLLPGRNVLAKCAREAHRLLTAAGHSLWWGNLGNKL